MAITASLSDASLGIFETGTFQMDKVIAEQSPRHQAPFETYLMTFYKVINLAH
jgi:hypothetical protein